MRRSTSTMFSARSLAASAAVLFAALTNLPAQSVTTTPVGAVTLNVSPASGSTRAITALSFPLVESASVTGATSGVISSVTANSLTVTNAGWTAGQLSSAAAPILIQITNGSAAGQIFLVSSATPNTATTLTIDAEEAGQVNLTNIGIQANTTTFRLLNGDTLASLFGTPATTGIVGATTAANADTIQVSVGGLWRTYFYSTTSNAWLRVGPNTNSNNTPIRPDSLVLFSRIGTSPLALTLTGSVPNSDRKALVRNSGTTALSTGWPVDLTLQSSAIADLPGWVKSTNPAVADTVQIFVDGLTRSFYHNGTQWLRVGPNTPSNTVSLPATGGVLINKRGSATGAAQLAQALPYSL